VHCFSGQRRATNADHHVVVELEPVCACVGVRVCVRTRVCVHVCARGCVFCLCARAHVCMSACACVRAYVSFAAVLEMLPYAISARVVSTNTVPSERGVPCQAANPRYE
jgi:hypothetical protein